MSAATSIRVTEEHFFLESAKDIRSISHPNQELLELVTKLAWVIEVQTERLQILETLVGRRNVRREQRRREAMLQADTERCGDQAADPPEHLLATDAEIAADPAFHLAPTEANLRMIFARRFENDGEATVQS
jgi:hypothetical protein